MILLRRERGNEKMRLEKNCDREVQLQMCVCGLAALAGVWLRAIETDQCHRMGHRASGRMLDFFLD